MITWRGYVIIHLKLGQYFNLLSSGVMHIQSALNVDDKNKEKTELRPLLSTRDYFKKVVITKTRMKPWVDDNGIFHIGLYDFLLDKDCLR